MQPLHLGIHHTFGSGAMNSGTVGLPSEKCARTMRQLVTDAPDTFVSGRSRMNGRMLHSWQSEPSGTVNPMQ